MGPTHTCTRISVTALQCYRKCGHQYYLRYIQGLPSALTPSMLVGKAVDYAVSMVLTARLKGDDLAPLITTIARDHAMLLWEQPILLGNEYSDANEARRATIKLAVDLASLFRNELLDRLQPINVQRQWSWPLGSWELVGVIDLEEHQRIRDLKCLRQPPPSDLASRSEQLLMYAWWYRNQYGVIPEVALDCLLYAGRVLTLRAQPTNTQLQQFERRLLPMLDAIEKGIFIPASTEAWWCSPNYCSFWPNCIYGGER